MFNTQPPYNIQNFLDAFALRNFGTTYTNNTGKTLWVEAIVRLQASALNDWAEVSGQSPIGSEVSKAYLKNLGGAVTTMIPISFAVKPGAEYALMSYTGFGGQTFKVGWIEVW